MALSHKVYMLMVQMAAPVGCENFLIVFGTPTLLWRVLHFAGYHELPLFHWIEEYLEGQPWYEVRLTILARTQPPFWQVGKAESEEEEVEPEEGDGPISDLDSDHDED